MNKVILVNKREEAKELVRLAFGDRHSLDVYLGDMSAEEFTNSRKGKVGGSDCGTIFSATKNSWKYDSALETECAEKLPNYGVYGEYVYEKKAGKPKLELVRRLRRPDIWQEDPTITDATKKVFARGHRNEPVIAQLYAEESGDLVYEFPWRVIFDDIPDGIKDIDYLCQSAKTGEFYILEIKNPQVWSTQKGWKIMASRGNPDNLSGLVDETYLMQVWFYLSGSNMKYGKICAGGWSLDEIGYTKIEKLPQNSEEEMINSVNDFVRKAKNPRLEITDADYPDKKAILDAYSTTYKYQSLSPALLELDKKHYKKVRANIEARREADLAKEKCKEAIKKLEEELGIAPKITSWKGALQNRLDASNAAVAEIMDDHETGSIVFPDGSKHKIKYTYSESSSFDKKAFSKDYPELAKLYTKRKITSRKITIS